MHYGLPIGVDVGVYEFGVYEECAQIGTTDLCI